MKFTITRKALVQKDMLEKCCATLQSYWLHMENKLFLYKIIMSHNMKYYVKSFKRNKLKLSDIRGL